MAVCPKCKANISFLKLKEFRLYESDFTYYEGKIEEKNVKMESTTKFLCPNCQQELFDITEQEKAEAFLRGE
ncbi:MAG: hypothetical protein QXH20_05675 [Candidatus Bathyarchaeia archaeon]